MERAPTKPGGVPIPWRVHPVLCAAGPIRAGLSLECPVASSELKAAFAADQAALANTLILTESSSGTERRVFVTILCEP